MQFKDIVGQKDIINSLVKNVLNNRVSHAQMLIGYEGSGNLNIALAYSQFVNCTNKQIFDDSSLIYADSCGECPSCLKSAKLIHPDIHFVFPITTTKKHSKKVVSKEFYPEWRKFVQENNGFITLDDWYNFIEVENKQGIISAEECNEIINTLNYKTFESEYKVVIIWMIEKLYYSAAPKILKLLEEPPEKTLFLLIANDYQQILDTILSRIQFIKLGKPSRAEIQEYLNKHFDIPQESIAQLCFKHNNNITEIISSIKNVNDDNKFMNFFVEWMRACYRGQIDSIIKFADEFRSFGREKQKNFFEFCSVQIRNSFYASYSERLLKYHDSEQSNFYQNFGKYLRPKNADLIYTELNKGVHLIERNANPKILFTDISLKIGTFLKISH